MDLKNRHPLNAIDGYENLSMLEALIPFVDYQLKLPLALFIKFNEVRLIIKCFQSPHNLTRLGLHCATTEPWDMICALTGMSPEVVKMMMSMMNNGDGGSMFSDLFNGFSNNASNECKSNCNTENSTPFGDSFSSNNITNVMNMMQNMQPGFSNGSECNKPEEIPTNTTSKNCNTNTSYEPDDFEDNIQRLLAEYDLQQASALAENDTIH